MTTTICDPFAFTSGRRDAPVLLVGEAWGADEAVAKRPFVGSSGRELTRMLMDARVSPTDVLMTNVVDSRPPGNEFTHFLYPTKGAPADAAFNGLYAKPELRAGVSKLLALIAAVKPKLIIGAGNVPLWALTSHAKVSTSAGYKLPSGIMSFRGSQLHTVPIDGVSYPFLPIIHPAAILRSWDLRSVTVHDLKTRAGRFLNGERPSWTEPPRHTLHRPTFKQAHAYLSYWIYLAGKQELLLACDIETLARKYVVCLGLADNTREICLPFFGYTEAGEYFDYFSTTEEIEIWRLLSTLLRHPNTKIIGQNYMYDWQFLARLYGIDAPVSFDTMLAHHLLWPGTPKSLDYLASLYCDHYVYWKDESQDWAATGGSEQLWLYNCKDVRATYDIALELKSHIEKLKMTSLYESQLSQWRLTTRMLRRGVNCNATIKSQMHTKLVEASTEMEHFLLSCMPEALRYSSTGTPWYNSPTMLTKILYEQLKIPPVLHKKTKRPTSDATAIDAIKSKVPWLKPMLDVLEKYRSVNVFISHFLTARLGVDGRLRCAFNIGGTETFRWSSNETAFGEGTNLQNIPKGDKED